VFSAAAGSDLGLGLSPLFGPSSSSKAGSSAILRGGGRPLILVGPTLATNFLSTSLIGLQAWCVCAIPSPQSWHDPFFFLVLNERCISCRRKRHKLIDHLGRYGLAIQTEKIFALLVESGFAYCCFWVRRSVFALFMTVPGVDILGPFFFCRFSTSSLPFRSFRTRASLSWTLCSLTSLYAFSFSPPHLSSLLICLYRFPFARRQSLYPTVVVIFVVLRKSPTFMITRRHASAHFSEPPPLSRSRMETRIPLSMMYSPNEDQLHTGSDMTALPSPLFDSKDKL
jgi:hypothetical protein